jgi:hypothetical protein
MTTFHRRAFLQSTAAALAATTAAAELAPRPIRKTTRLYPDQSKDLDSPMLTEILCLEENIICLRYTLMGGPATVRAMQPSGDLLWQHPLPPGMYVGLGATDRGRSILIQTMDSGILCLRDGALSWRGTANTSTFLEKMYYAGDDLLIRPASLQIELWSAEGSLHLLRGIPATIP